MKKVLVLCLVLMACWWSAVPNAQVAKVVFLAPFDGAGTDANPFRVRGFGTVGNLGCIDVRPDPTQAAGRAICGADSLPAGQGIVQLSSRLDEKLTAQRRAQLESALGVTISADATPIEILQLILIELPKTDSRWKALRPSVRDGKLKIHLGGDTPVYQKTAGLPFEDNGLFADVALGLVHVANVFDRYVIGAGTAWALTLATETFTGTDGDLNGRTFVHPWTENQGTGWTIVSNQASITTTGQNDAWMDASLATDDHSVTVTLVSITTPVSLMRCGPIARKPNSATRTYYMWYADAVSSGPEYSLAKRVSGTFTQLTNNTQDPVNGDVLTLEVDGSNLTGKVNGITLAGPTTDVSITGSTYLGIIFNTSSGSNQTCVLDNLIGADITAAPASFGPFKRGRGAG